MSDERLSRFLLRAASAAAALAMGYAALRWLLPWLLPFLLAAAVAAAMEPAVAFLQRKVRLRRSFASLVLTLFLLFHLGGLLSLLGSTLTGEAYALLGRVPAMLNEAPDALDRLLARLVRFGAPRWAVDSARELLRRSFAEAGSLAEALTGRLLGRLASFAPALPRVFLAVATTVLAVYFTSSSWPLLKHWGKAKIPARLRKKLNRLRVCFYKSIFSWLKAEGFLCCVTFSELMAGFFLMRQPYSLLLALLITLVDALPVFGAGTVLIPWAAAELLFGTGVKGAALLALYLLTLGVRSALEPRLLGAQAGLPPIASLLAMYLGFCALGVGGMVLFPFLLLLLAQLWQQTQNGPA